MDIRFPSPLASMAPGRSIFRHPEDSQLKCSARSVNSSAAGDLNQSWQHFSEGCSFRIAEFEIDLPIKIVERCVRALRLRLRFVDSVLWADFVLRFSDRLELACSHEGEDG